MGLFTRAVDAKEANAAARRWVTTFVVPPSDLAHGDDTTARSTC
jgi:hypothetical protein